MWSTYLHSSKESNVIWIFQKWYQTHLKDSNLLEWSIISYILHNSSFSDLLRSISLNCGKLRSIVQPLMFAAATPVWAQLWWGMPIQSKYCFTTCVRYDLPVPADPSTAETCWRPRQIENIVSVCSPLHWESAHIRCNRSCRMKLGQQLRNGCSSVWLPTKEKMRSHKRMLVSRLRWCDLKSCMFRMVVWHVVTRITGD